MTPETIATDRNGRAPRQRHSRKRGGWAFARGRPADASIEHYHEHQLRDLLERVREGFAMLDAGEIDAYGLDELIARYRDGAQALHEFCASTGREPQRAALTLAALREQGEEPDWWRTGAEPNRRRG